MEHIAKPAFIIACASNCALAITGALTIEGGFPAGTLVAVVLGGVAFVVATVSGLLLLREIPAPTRGWIKAALVFLVLGPLAFWGIQQPAVAQTLCIDNLACYRPEGIESHARAVADVIQSQFAMIAVALAALVCAARTMAAFLDELAA